MIRSEFAKAMRAKGWLHWRHDPSGCRTSFVCEVPGCTGTKVITDDEIARGLVPGGCQRRHVHGFGWEVMESHVALQNHLLQRRRALGLAQMDVEAAAGFTGSHIAKLETGIRVGQLPTYIIWAETLGYDIALVPKGLPPQTLAIIDHKAGRPVPERRPPSALLLDSSLPAPGCLSAIEGIARAG